MKYKGVIFDRDGTLFDSLDVILRGFDYAVQPYIKNRPTTKEWIDAFGPAEKEVLGKFISSDKKQIAFQRFFNFYREHFAEVQLYPGMREVLDELKATGAKLMLFTGGGNVSTWFCLEQSGILPLFNSIICGEDVIHPKPDPEGVLKLMREQRLNPEETIVVGDSPADIIAGKSAKTFTAWLNWSENAQLSDLTVAPDFTCPSVHDLKSVLL